MLREVQAWTKRHAPPICTFLPDRLRDANDNVVNQTNFRSLSRVLFENQMVNGRPPVFWFFLSTKAKMG